MYIYVSRREMPINIVIQKSCFPNSLRSCSQQQSGAAGTGKSVSNIWGEACALPSMRTRRRKISCKIFEGGMLSSLQHVHGGRPQAPARAGNCSHGMTEGGGRCALMTLALLTLDGLCSCVLDPHEHYYEHMLSRLTPLHPACLAADRWTTCDRKTALDTIVYRVVMMLMNKISKA